MSRFFYATYSTDGGVTFAPAFPVNGQTPGVNTPNGNVLDPDPGAQVRYAGPPPTTRIGEYFGLAIRDGTAYVAWTGNAFAGFNNPTGQQVWTKAFAIRGSLTFTGTPGNDYIIIRSIAGNPDFVEVIVNGQREYAGLWSALTGITVNATAGDDEVNIDDTPAGTPVTVILGSGTNVVGISLADLDLGTIQSPMTIHGGSGTDQVILRDENNGASTTYALTPSLLSRPGAAGISYDHIGQILLRGGTGNDTYNAVGVLQSTLTIAAGFGSNTLVIDGASSTADTTYRITGSPVTRTGFGAISYSGTITNLVVTGGSGNNTYNIASTPSGSPITLNTGNGVDTINVQGSAGPLFINSGSGGATITVSNSTAKLAGIGHVILNDPSNSDTVTVDDSGFTDTATYTLTSTQLTADAWPNFLLSYNNVASLNLNGSSGNDSFEIKGTASVTATTISAGSGSNRFDLTPTDQYLADIAGPLNLSGSGADTLVFWDTANPNAETYTFDDIPSTLALATVPTFAASWSGMGSVYLATNGMSTVNDPSGTVQVDVPPPSGPNRAQPPRTPFRAAEGGLIQALLDAVLERHAALADASPFADILVADLLHQA